MLRHPRTAVVSILTAGVVAAGAATAAYAFADPTDAPPTTTTTTSSTATPTGQERGTVYANRKLASSRVPVGASRAQEYSYWTVSADRSSHLAVATVAIPKGHAPSGGWPVVVRASRGHGLSAACAPSRNPVAADVAGTADLLHRGFAVITPDYSSIGATTSPQYTDISTAARMMVDAVQAGHTVVDGVVSPRWAVFGESQGAAAAIALARQATVWQSGDLDYRGSAAAGIPAGFDELLTGLSPSSPGVNDAVVADVVYALASVTGYDLDDVLSASGKRLVAKAATACDDELGQELRGVALASLVTKPLASKPKLVTALRRSLNLPVSGFNRPLLLSQPLINDDVMVPTALRYLVDAQRSSNKVQTVSYFTGDQNEIVRRERAAVGKFLTGLF
ncbi:MAG: alpha/beta hydrolase [Gordonia sp. (in: high G+C Gram-positive bacteria)]